MPRKLFSPIVIIFSCLFVAFSSFKHLKRINCTELNGAGCVCHGIQQSTILHVWCEGPSVLETGTSAVYRVYLAGGPALGGGHNVAVRYGIMDTVDNLSVLIDNELTQSRPIPFPTRFDTLWWAFKYTAPDTAVTDTLYSCGLSTNHDGAPDIGDDWQFGPKFVISVIPKSVPVELELLSLISDKSGRQQISIQVNSEKNNRGFSFEIDEVPGKQHIGFLPGSGTSLNRKQYLFSVPDYALGKRIRVIQHDFSGSTTVLGIVNTNGKSSNGIDIFPLPAKDMVSAVFSVNEKSSVSFSIINISGEKVLQLNTYINPGTHTVKIPVSRLTTGVYLLLAETATRRFLKKFTVVR